MFDWRRTVGFFGDKFKTMFLLLKLIFFQRKIRQTDVALGTESLGGKIK